MANRSADVLIVEDEHLIAMGVELSLTDARIGAQVVGTAAAALEAMGRGAWRGAIVDVGLPDGRGDELVERMRAIDPNLPIVFCTGFAMHELRSNAFANGGVIVVGKPFHPAEIVTALLAAESIAPLAPELAAGVG